MLIDLSHAFPRILDSAPGKLVVEVEKTKRRDGQHIDAVEGTPEPKLVSDPACATARYQLSPGVYRAGLVWKIEVFKKEPKGQPAKWYARILRMVPELVVGVPGYEPPAEKKPKLRLVRDAANGS